MCFIFSGCAAVRKGNQRLHTETHQTVSCGARRALQRLTASYDRSCNYHGAVVHSPRESYSRLGFSYLKNWIVTLSTDLTSVCFLQSETDWETSGTCCYFLNETLNDTVPKTKLWSQTHKFLDFVGHREERPTATLQWRLVITGWPQ